MKLRLIILLLGLKFNLQAQNGNLLFLGVVENDSLGQVTVEIDQRYLDNSLSEYGSLLTREGKFGFVAQLAFPQLAQIRYQKLTKTVFLSPDDTLYLSINPTTFPEKVKFGGSLQRENEAWDAFRTFLDTENQFEYLQFRKGVYFYKIHERVKQQMQTLPPDSFGVYLQREKMAKETFLQNYPHTLSTPFKTYLRAEIEFDYLYKKMAYGHIWGGRWRLDSNYFQFLNGIDSLFSDDYIPNPKYREFVTAYIHFRNESPNLIADNPYTRFYYLCKSQLRDKTRYFLMAQAVDLAFRKDNPAQMLGIYEDFLLANPYMELDKLVTDALNRHQPEQKRLPAPNFSLPDSNQVRRSLRDWQGKWVYVDFWASWCRPCIKKMADMQPLIAQWGDKIVFVHISLDANQQIWLDFIRENQLSGLHLYSSPKSQTLLDYQVLAVPRYFIISPDGNFEFAPATLDVGVINEHLRKLLE